MPTKTEKSVNNTNSGLSFISKIGFLLTAFALIVAVLNYFPAVTQEIGYITKNATNNGTKVDGGPKIITPVDADFGIVVPKIGANARIVADVDPFNSLAYQTALTKGIAHAAGTAKPNEIGNVFLFAHSSDNFFNANKYNSVFYLLHRLEKGDKFILYYKGEKYEYEVTEKSIVEATDVDYMSQTKDDKVATLMTCWPPGTTLKRLVIVGVQL